MPDAADSPAHARVLIAESAELVRRGIRDVLAQDRRFSVVGEIERPGDIVRAYRELSPDIMLLGLEADNEDNPDGLAALRQTLRLDPRARVIVLVDGDAVEHLLQPVRAGAKGVLLRDAPAGRLLEAMADVLAGGATLDSRLTGSLFEHWSLAASVGLPGAEAPRLALAPAVLRLLSPREQEVLRCLARGCRNKEIATQLGVSVGTVKTHLRHIFRKLVVADRTAAVLTALQAHLPEAA